MLSALYCARHKPDSLRDEGCKPDAPDIQMEHHGKQKTGNRIDQQYTQYRNLFGDTGLSDTTKSTDINNSENLQENQCRNDQTCVKSFLQGCSIVKKETEEEVEKQTEIDAANEENEKLKAELEKLRSEIAEKNSDAIVYTCGKALSIFKKEK